MKEKKIENKNIITSFNPEDGSSFDIKKEKINRLKEHMPEVFSEGDKLDVDKLKKTLGEFMNEQNERYVLNWAGKSEAFKVLQRQTTATLAPDGEESINFDTTNNIFIEGENLEVLKVLQKSYFGKIKMIYIDPPYNTGNDSFIYPDKFEENKSDYLKRIGEKDVEGFLLKEGLFRKNSKENGQYHSNWLSMMYPRLFLARNLLREDGVIFVSIDDNEVHNLRMIMNEIFGEENFVGMFIWHSRQNVDSRSLNGASIDHEYVVCYTKIQSNRLRGKEINREKYSNPDNDPRGPWMSSPIDGIATKDKRPNLHYNIINVNTGLEYKPAIETGWRFQRSTIEKLILENRIIWPKNPNSKPRFKRYLNELENDFTGFSSMLNVDFTSQGTKELRNLMGTETLKFPKPISIVKTLLEQGTTNEEIILDFFAGSGTTAQAVLELNKEDNGNRKFILAQLPEMNSEDSEAFKAGYKTIADICKERIRRVIKNLESENKNEQLKLNNEEKNKQNFGFKVFKLKHSNFKLWRSDVIENADDLSKQLDAFEDPVKKEAEELNIVYELILKLGLDLNVKIQKQIACVDGEGKFVNGVHEDNVSGNFEWWDIDSGKLIIITKADMNVSNLFNHLKSENIKPEKVICLDKIFNGNDEAKTNLVLQMKDAGVEFKTV
ncbi:MAG: site-specific DNA-methyltransferase [Bacteroidota bacterium]|nr:site-specific DNA-methyltransferase [Bacteroidota bacterium]